MACRMREHRQCRRGVECVVVDKRAKRRSGDQQQSPKGRPAGMPADAQRPEIEVGPPYVSLRGKGYPGGVAYGQRGEAA